MAQHTGKVSRAQQAIGGTKRTCQARQRRHRYLEGVETARRLRPFARRRLSTARPAFVFIRARKPWTRLRRIRLG